jgi:hypothetical protein
MEELKWIARTDGFAIDVMEEKTGFGIVHIGTNAELKDADYPIERAIANAHLIAAAPELLKKIQELRALIDDISPSCAAGDDQLSVLKRTMDNLINKALGI